MKRLTILCCMLCACAIAMAQGGDTNQYWRRSLVENVQSVGSISNVSCFDGRLFFNNAGILFSMPLSEGSVADIDTLYATVDREMNYVVKHPVSGNIYYTKHNGKRSQMCEIYTDDKGRRKTRQVRLPRFKASIVHPVFSKDGTIMVFSSDAEEGMGGFDLWYCRQGEDGWGEPVNLGTRINTPGHEFSPFVWGDYLFFSSDRVQAEQKDYDIFATRLVSLHTVHGDTVSTFPIGTSPVQRMPAPMNSSQNDFGIIVSPDGTDIFYVSRREGASCDNMFHIAGTVHGVVYEGHVEAYDNTGFASDNSIPNATLSVLDAQGSVLYTARADSNGHFRLYMPVEAQLNVRTAARNYLSVTEPFDVSSSDDEVLLSSWSYSPTLLYFAQHTKHPYQAQSLFGTESGSDLTADGKAVLESVVRFTKENPHLKLFITAVYGRHKNDNYCAMLNRSRLQSIFQFFAQQGIDVTTVDTRSSVGVYKRTSTDNAVFDNVILFEFK